MDASVGLGLGPGGSDINVTMMNTVWLNRTIQCEVVFIKGTSMTCVIPAMRAGTYVVDIEVNGGDATTPHGFATQPDGGPVTVNFPLVLDAVTPVVGSAVGGTRLTLSGVGFDPGASDVVLVGSQPCAVLSATYTLLTCVTPPPGDAWTSTVAATGSLTVDVVVNGIAGLAPFTYSAIATPAVVSISPPALSSGITGIETLTLSNLPPDTSVSSMSVAFGTRACSTPTLVSATVGSISATLSNLPVSVNGACGAGPGTQCSPGTCCSQFGYCGSDTSSHCVNCQTAYGYCPIRAVISCLLVRDTAPPLPQTTVTPSVYVAGVGFANASGTALDVSLFVSSISTTSGSLLGGTVVNFTGAG